LDIPCWLLDIENNADNAIANIQQGIANIQEKKMPPFFLPRASLSNHARHTPLTPANG
jgi:hypothetical protein